MKFGKTMRQIQEATQDRPFFPIDWAYFRLITRGVFVTGDTVKVRMLMALASVAWVLIIIGEPHMFERHGYEFMRILPRWFWLMVFGVHGFGAIWRIYERKKRERVATVINFIGLGAWLSTTIAMNCAIGTIAAGTALEAFACVLLFFATVRTARNREGVTD